MVSYDQYDKHMVRGVYLRYGSHLCHSKVFIQLVIKDVQIRWVEVFASYAIRHVPMAGIERFLLSKFTWIIMWQDGFRWLPDIVLYRIISNTTDSISRIRSFQTAWLRPKPCHSDNRTMSDTAYSTDRISSVLMACIRSESGSSDNRTSPENVRIHRITVGSIRSDLVVVCSRISNPSDRIRSPLHLLGYLLCLSIIS